MQWFWPTATEQTSFAIRLGRGLHWLSYGVAAIPIALIGIGSLQKSFISSGDETLLLKLIALAAAGRLARYVLASE